METEEKIYKGLPASKGIAIGEVFVYKTESHYYDIKDKFSDPATEISDYESAIRNSIKELNKIFNLAKEKLDDTNLQIFDAQLTFLYDDLLHSKIKQRILQENKPAHIVFSEEIKKLEDALMNANDDHLRERVNDIEDIKNRVLRNLNKGRLFSKIKENAIVVARNLTPADTILFSNRNLLGIATDLGGINSHVSIISRSLKIPAVVGMHDISVHISSGDMALIDGYKGVLIKNPSENTIAGYTEKIKQNLEFEKKLEELEKLPSETKDGVKINLSVNLEFNDEIDYVTAHFGCDVGLYRTEHMFLEYGDFPDEETQYRQYKFLAEHVYPGKVTIRTFDIGGDKILPEHQKELNPFLGWRGIRISLDKEDILQTQFKAILRASTKGNVKIMLPLVSSVDEVIKSRKILLKAMEKLDESNFKYDRNIKLGIMAEVPSVVFMAEDFADVADFFSIGTNDLIQYTLAVDRDSSLVSHLYQKFHPSVLKAIKALVDGAASKGIPVNVCGEMSSDPCAVALLIGLGIKELSVEPISFLRIKNIIRQISYTHACEIAEKALQMNTENEIRNYLCEFYNEIKTEVN
ncbi:MAG: phosphoenolpyruvate--protein phosphotransferase [Ignavibacteria bacterium]|nr:phosphoenolpyruvate--protein phosphotransferase [Ignavibacteria bacterium]